MRTFLIILLCSIVLLSFYFYSCRKETFTNTQDLIDEISRIATSIGEGEIPAGTIYVEDLSKIPSHTSLKLYLTTFSYRTHYNNAIEIYVPETQRWNNFIAGNQSFFITGQNIILPAVLRDTGMPLKGTKLVGIQPEQLNSGENRFSLLPFSISFYIKFVTIPNTSTELFTIPLEAPNYARLTITNDNNTYIISGQIGEANDDNTVIVSITQDILGQGDPICITMTFNKTVDYSDIHIYVGHSNGTPPTYTPIVKNSKSMPVASNLILGNSRMTINKNTPTGFEAQLYGFMYFTGAIDESMHSNIASYFKTQKTSPVVFMDVVKTSLSSNISTLNTLLSDTQVTQGVLQKQLDECKAATAVPTTVEKAFNHTIKFDGVSSVSSEDLRACSILEIRNRINEAVSATPILTSGSNTGRFDIPYTSDKLAASSSIPP